MRSLARECVFKYIFSKLFNPSDEGLFAVLCNTLGAEDKDFAKSLLSCIEKDEQKYLTAIENLAVGYKLDRIHVADKCVIMLGMAELDNFKNTPKAVVINESVNLVAKYSTENSANFVNGILAEYAKEML